MTDFFEQTRDNFDSECWQICYELGLKESQSVKINEYLWKHLKQSLTEAYQRGIEDALKLCGTSQEDFHKYPFGELGQGYYSKGEEIREKLQQKLKGE